MILLQTRFSIVSMAAASALLYACGGGVDDTPTVSAGVLPIQTAAVPGSYLTAGLGDALDFLNRERLRCGLGVLKQNAMLDEAAKNHALYVSSRSNFGDPHWETPGEPGFTGITPTDRAQALGYAAPSGEVLEVGVLPWMERDGVHGSYLTMEDFPTHAIRSDLAAPYHAMALISSAVDVGLALEGRNETVNGYQTVIMSFFATLGRGDSTLGQVPNEPTVRTFPCEGTEGLQPALFGEWLPTGPLFPDRHPNTHPTGHPIYVVGEHGTQLTIDSAVITRVSNGGNVPVYEIRTQGTDTVHGSLYREPWVGFIFPDVPFVPFQSYRVRVEGKSDAKPFVKEFTFTSGQYGHYDEGIVRALGLPTR